MSPTKSIAGALVLLFSSACVTLNQAPHSVLLQGDNLDALSEQVLAVGGEVTHQLPVINGIGARLSQAAIDQLQRSPEVERLIIDQGITKSSQDAQPTQAVAQWFESTSGRPSINSRLADLTGASALHQLGSSGKGVGIAILDTGLWVDPEGQRPLNQPQYNAISDRINDTIDLDGHGTHLASLIKGVEQQFIGIAPDATLIDIKAFDRLGEANFLDVIRGVQWVIQHRPELDIHVLNVSISASPELAYWLDPVNQALTAAWHAGIIVVVAAGNSGPEHGSVTSPANNPWLLTIGAIDTGASASRADDRVAPFSAGGPTTSGHIKPDLVVPGTFLAGVLPPTSTRSTSELTMDEQGLWVASGTSQAAAVTSGLIALLIENDPSLTNNDIKCLLTSGADQGVLANGQPAYSPFRQGRGYVNLNKAITHGTPDCESSLKSFSPDTQLVGKVTEEQTDRAKQLDAGALPRGGLGNTAVFWGTSPE